MDTLFGSFVSDFGLLAKARRVVYVVEFYANWVRVSAGGLARRHDARLSYLAFRAVATHCEIGPVLAEEVDGLRFFRLLGWLLVLIILLTEGQ